jgi:hypothetical protein
MKLDLSCCLQYVKILIDSKNCDRVHRLNNWLHLFFLRMFKVHPLVMCIDSLMVPAF